MKQMIEAVDYMMQKQILHRDLKVGNTFIDDQMRLKIGDFGLAWELNSHGILLNTQNEEPEYFLGHQKVTTNMLLLL